MVVAAAASLMFMVCGGMKECKEIVLPTDTLVIFLAFIYTGKFEIDSDNFSTILEAAYYYKNCVLESRCIDFIATFLSSESCCSMYHLIFC